MSVEIDWNEIACCYGCATPKEIPKDLVEIIQHLDSGVKDANGMRFSPRADFGLRSTQVIALVVLLYKKGILK